MPRVSVKSLSNVHPDVEPTLSGQHELELARCLNDPLPLFTIPDDVLLDGLGVVVLAVLLEDRACVIEVTYVLPSQTPDTEDAKTSEIDAGSEHSARGHLVLVQEDVGGRGLRIAGRCHTVGEVC